MLSKFASFSLNLELVESPSSSLQEIPEPETGVSPTTERTLPSSNLNSQPHAHTSHPLVEPDTSSQSKLFSSPREDSPTSGPVLGIKNSRYQSTSRSSVITTRVFSTPLVVDFQMSQPKDRTSASLTREQTMVTEELHALPQHSTVSLLSSTPHVSALVYQLSAS